MEENTSTNLSPNKNNNLWTWVIIILIIIVGSILWFLMKSNGSSYATNPNVPANTPVVAPATTPSAPPSAEDTTVGSIDAGTAVSLSYTDALVTYANARLQLDTNCQALASPAGLVFRNNSLLMVDNRAPVTRTIHLGSVFTIKPYSFKIIKLYSAKLPATWLVDCDSSQNVATVLIEK